MKINLAKSAWAIGLAAAICMAHAVLSEECIDCHDDAELTLERADGSTLSIFMNVEKLVGTPHEGFACMDCHTDIDEAELPHGDPVPSAVVHCLDCHDDLGESHAFHAGFADISSESVTQENFNCTGCHGAHEIEFVTGDAITFAKDKQATRCGKCHENISLDYLHSSHAQAVHKGNEFGPSCLDCHRYPDVVEAFDLPIAEHKVHLVELCLHCHVDEPHVSGQTLYGTPFVKAFKGSVHGKALYEGNADAPGCIDCHGSHYVSSSYDKESRVNQNKIINQCSNCHIQEAEDYLHSIHAEVLAMGYQDAPVCTDCHGEHNILRHTDPDSPVASMNSSQQVCGECHGSVKLTQRFGLESDRLSTYEESYHGLASRGGAVEVVNCASCHGFHDIRKSDDPESWIYPDNLAKTCGSCHEGANERFAVSKMHVSVSTKSSEPVLYWIATIYVFGIFLIIGLMLLHNGLDLLHKIRRKAKEQWGSQEMEEMKPLPHRLYVRMTLNERLQHALLAISFIVLVITGFMLKSPDAWWVVGLRNLNDNLFELRGLVHRFAAVTMCLAGAWHLIYISFTKNGRKVLIDLLPRWKDLSDMKGILLYNLGINKRKPLLDRFSYIEKVEYWALMWGSVVMTVTGFLLWYSTVTIGLFTKLGFDISLAIHYYEAILASLAIIVWHFYFVIFNPDVYPMNLAWLTGKNTEEEMAKEHPLELERLKKAEADQEGIKDSTAKN